MEVEVALDLDSLLAGWPKSPPMVLPDSPQSPASSIDQPHSSGSDVSSSSDEESNWSALLMDGEGEQDQQPVKMMELMGMDPLLSEGPFCDSAIEQLPLFEPVSPFNLDDLSPLQSSTFQNSILPPLPVINAAQSELESQPEAQDKKSTTRKRRRPNFTTHTSSRTKPPENFVELPPEELLKLDSTEMEKYIQDLAAYRSMSPSEERELKKMRRLIKNREYAQSSRNKRKQYMEEMEKKLQEIVESKQILQQRIEALESENKTLKQQVYKLATAIKSDPEILDRLRAKVHSQRSSNVAKTGVVLFAVMLFAISFSWLGFFAGSHFDNKLNSMSTGNINKWNTGRVLLGNEMIAEQPSGFYAKYTPLFIQDFVARHLGFSPMASAPLEEVEFWKKTTKYNMDMCLAVEDEDIVTTAGSDCQHNTRQDDSFWEQRQNQFNSSPNEALDSVMMSA